MLSRSKLAAYGFLSFPLAALTLPIQIFLPTYYAENLGLGLAAVGLILLAVRLFDVISDPLIGILSDRTTSKFGRRKPWVLSGLPLVLIGSYALLIPPEEAGAYHLTLFSLMLYLGWTMMILPLNAWGAELSKDYHERTTISAWREGLTIAGILAALSLIAAFNAGDEQALALKLIAFFILATAPLAAFLALKYVPDTPHLQTKARIPLKDSAKVIMHNKPFMRLIASYVINGLANALPATLFLIFVKNALGMEDQAGQLLFLYFLCGVIAVPFWNWLSKKYGKHKTWCFAMIWACVFFALVPFVSEGDITLFLAITILTGFSLGADLVLPAAIQADIVDVDEAKTKQKRTGLFFALWSMATKLSLALAAGIAFPTYGWSGESLMILIALYALIPITLKAIAIAMMWSFPLDEKTLIQTRARAV